VTRGTRVLGLDVGDVRIGVALSDPMAVLATPLTIINRTEEPDDIQAILDLVEEHEVGRIVVGLPLSMDGTQSKQTDKVRAFELTLSRQTKVPVEFWDERLSTVTAKRMVQVVRKKTERGIRYDAMAAALILQGYLDKVF
jgi:putative Holliday junction resolvase